MDLFDKAYEQRMSREAPLAARMRPRTIEEFAGQDHIIGPGRLLRRAIQADQLGSLIFYGPPGTGKTTLARVIANTTEAHFTAINAVLAGVKDIRKAIDEAKERGRIYAQRTILFVDEVHRFNKAQQDALLPWVENGTVIFVGATTENPYFEVNRALVSRSRIFQLEQLRREHLREIVDRTLRDEERGYGLRHVVMDDKALEHLVEVADGDARAVLNALELALETTPPQEIDGRQTIHITLEVAEESIQHRAVLYDKEGDYHFDTISAFIKSVRGSDPDATLYWLAKMVYAGEPPRFIFRRMLILAAEDVGLADPQAIQVVTACAQAFEQVGLPEGRFHLAEAALYLATCEKSNTTLAFFDALKTVKKEGDSGVPNHLRDPSRDSEGFGHGEGYLYPHAFRDHWVDQQYLPSSLQGRLFYQPSSRGYEATIKVEVARKREAQLAAMLNAEEGGGVASSLERLTFSPEDPDRERWLRRTISNAGAQLGELRDRVLEGVAIQRHALVLDLRVGAGLLTWDALRRAPEGGVYAVAWTQKEALAIRAQAESLDEVERPVVIEPDSQDVENDETSTSIPLILIERLRSQEPGLRFDAIVGHNALAALGDKRSVIVALGPLLAEGGIVGLAENIPRHTQRIHALFDGTSLSADLLDRLRSAEEAIYASAEQPMVNWDAEDLVEIFRSVDAFEITNELRDQHREVRITPALLDRWFKSSDGAGRKTYAEHLSAELSAEEIVEIRSLFERQLLGETVRWHSKVLYLIARLPM